MGAEWEEWDRWEGREPLRAEGGSAAAVTSSGRKSRKRLVLVSLAAVLVVAGLPGVMARGAAEQPVPEPERPAAAPAPAPVAPAPVIPDPEPTLEPSPEPTPTPVQPEIGERAQVQWITDGDTVVTSAGKVRVIGIDTPERGVCGFDDATSNAKRLLPIGSWVTLTAVPGKDDTDKYGRLLRYVTTQDGRDLGYEQIVGGFAIARYDSRDGYGWHPKEAEYIAAERSATPVCAQPAGAAGDVYYANCAAARAAGAAPLYAGAPGYRPEMDGDSDGIACERRS